MRGGPSETDTQGEENISKSANSGLLSKYLQFDPVVSVLVDHPLDNPDAIVRGEVSFKVRIGIRYLSGSDELGLPPLLHEVAPLATRDLRDRLVIVGVTEYLCDCRGEGVRPSVDAVAFR